ncbi:MAG: TOBE domain-containing protein [Dongiaceae bacterium]
MVEAGHPDAVPARVDLVERVGSIPNVMMIIGEQTPVIANVDAGAPIRDGDTVHIRIPAARIQFFDAAGLRAEDGSATQ